MSGARERRLVFGEVAEQYDRARPGYPDALVDDVLAFAAHRDGERVFDIGAGTGKAAVAFAARGAAVVALEPDPAMAAVARRHLAAVAHAEVVETSFERWDPDPGGFAVVTAGQSWHWLEPAARLAKASAALRRGGALALFWNQPSYPDAVLRDALDDAYNALAPDLDGPFSASGERSYDATASAATEELRASSELTDVMVREYTNPIEYAAAAYVDLLGTHSDHRLLEESRRSRLLDRVGDAVAAAGGVVVAYRVTLVAGRRPGGIPLG